MSFWPSLVPLKNRCFQKGINETFHFGRWNGRTCHAPQAGPQAVGERGVGGRRARQGRLLRSQLLRVLPIDMPEPA